MSGSMTKWPYKRVKQPANINEPSSSPSCLQSITLSLYQQITMKFTSVTAAVVATLILPTFTLATSLSYDEAYDVGSSPLTTVACSDGKYGLITKNFTTFSSLPKFPYIGGASAIAGWNSANCGTCWQLTYTHKDAKGKNTTKSIDVLAIDHTDTGFNIALKAMDDLTGGLAKELGRVDVAAKQVASSVCGL